MYSDPHPYNSTVSSPAAPRHFGDQSLGFAMPQTVPGNYLRAPLGTGQHHEKGHATD